MRPIVYVLVASLAVAGIVRFSQAAPEAGAARAGPAPGDGPAPKAMQGPLTAQTTSPFPAADPPVSTTRPAEPQPMLHVVRHKHYRVPGTGPDDIAKQKAAQAEKAKAAEKTKAQKSKGKHAMAKRAKAKH